MKSFLRVCIGLIVLSAAARDGHASPPTITVLHAFNGMDGDGPYAPLLQASDGNFYGTTFYGGDDGHGCAQGCQGTVFKITPQGQFTLLHTFVGGGTIPAYRDGYNPYGGLAEGPDGYLYGTTFNGGFVTQGAAGTIYKISKTGQFQKLHDFCGYTPCHDGGNPWGSLALGSDGHFYGTVTSPPAFPSAFRISPTGDSYSVVAQFYNTGLGTPEKGLVAASDGNLYGVAGGGVYRITPPGRFSPLYFFTPAHDGSGIDALIQAADGNLYGANYSGPGNTGTVFRISLAGNFQKILGLTGSTTGTVPNALVQASDGNLWGTTAASTVAGAGRVYTVTTDGTFLQSIPLTTTTTGVQPQAPLIQGTDGKLYGTTPSHGLLPGGGFASGTVFVVDAGLGPKLTSIAVTAPNSSIAKGTTQQFTATGTYGDNSTADITTKVTWNSSNTGVAAIGASTGLATTVTTGSANITASLNGVTSNTFALTIAPGALASISITGPGTVVAGSTAQYLATGTYTDNSTANITTQVTWNSSNLAAATFAPGTGLATGTAAGSTNVSASLNGIMSNTLPLSVTAQTAPIVIAYRVLFGSQSYSLTATPRNRLPWQITGIQVVFSRPITSGNVNSLSGVTVTGLTGLGTGTLTWTINTLTLGAFSTALAGGGANALRDAMGNQLGGGAGFSQGFKVLLGDFNDDGAVSSADLVGVNNATVAPYNIFADINGDGVVNTADVQIVRTRIGTSQP